MPVMTMHVEKESRGDLTWTAALYGTEAMAARGAAVDGGVLGAR